MTSENYAAVEENLGSVLGFHDILNPMKGDFLSNYEENPLNSSIKLGMDTKKGSLANSFSQHSHSSTPSSTLFDTPIIPTNDYPLCPYCSKNFRKPKVLDCLHSMCEDCVIAQLDGRNETGGTERSSPLDVELEQSQQMRPTPPGVIKCPICSQESHVGNDVRFVNTMLLDFIRVREAETTDFKSGERVCRACKGDQVAIAVCRQCPSDLCRNCVQAHRDMRMFDGHKVILFNESGKTIGEMGDPAQNDELILCTVHHANFEHYCTTCDDLLCSHCLPDHVEHTTVALTEQFKHFYQNQFHELVMQVESKGKVTYDARSRIPERRAGLVTAYENCRQKIDTSFATFAQILDEIKLKTLSRLDKSKEDMDGYYETLYQKIDIQHAKIQDAITFVNQLIERGTAVELVASRKKVWQQLQNLLHSMPDANREIDLDFEISPKIELQQKFEGIIGAVKCVPLVPKDGDFVKSEGNKVPIEGAALAYNYSMKPNYTFPWANEQNELSVITSPAANILPRIDSQSRGLQSQTISSSNGPGTIGMERRNRASINSNGYSSSSFLSADSSGIFSADTVLSPVGNPIVSNPNTDTFGIGRNEALTQTTQLQRNSSNILNQFDNFNISSPINDPYGPQSKTWGTGYGSNQLALYNSDLPRARPTNIDSRYLASYGEYGLGMEDVTAGMRAASVCPTPSYGGSFAPSLNHHDGISKNRTIEMTINAVFGSTGETLNIPQGLALGLDDEIAIADTNNHRCLIFNVRGQCLRQIGSSGTEEGSLYYPKKVVSMVRMRECRFIILDRGANQSFSRLQMFRNDGEYISRMNSPYQIDQITVMAVNKERDELIIIDGKSNVLAFEIEMGNQMRLARTFSIAGFVHEASDLVAYHNNYYITDYKTHSVCVYTLDGRYTLKFGNSINTPYPIGIDVSKSGDILIGDSHGNHFHVVVFNSAGKMLQDYRCTSHKVSRCTGLKISTDGYVITMSRQNSSVLIFNTLYMPSN